MTASDHLQPQLFDPGPESPVMWHSSHRPLDQPWDPDRVGVTHVGTLDAAVQRNWGKGGVWTGGDQKAMYSVRVDGSKMHNTAQDPVSDGMGNSIYGRFTENPEVGGLIPGREDVDRFVRETNFSPNDQRYAEQIIEQRDTIAPGVVDLLGHAQPRKGVFYENYAEDIGSVSAAAPAQALTPLAKFETRHAKFDVEHDDKLASIGPVQEPGKSYQTTYQNIQPRLFGVQDYEVEGRELPRREYRHGGPEMRRIE